MPSEGDRVVIKATGEQAEVVEVDREGQFVKLRLRTGGWLWLRVSKVRLGEEEQ